MDNQEGSRFPAPLETPEAVAGGTEQLVDAIESHWRRVVAGLEPILGQSGVAAVFHHAVRQTASRYPWLASVLSDDVEKLCLSRLSEVFSTQNAEAASAAGTALFDAFGATLVSLLGDPLGNRLLQRCQSGAFARTPTADEAR